MTSNFWKRKLNVAKIPKPSGFENDTDDNGKDDTDVDWLTSSKRVRGGSLEDACAKAARLKNDGIILAENARFWEAVKLWDEALSLTPDAAEIYEMKAQALLELREDYSAVKAAEDAVRSDPLWYVAQQTLGRARLNLGELNMALKSFSIALHLCPWSDEIRTNDINWTTCLIAKRTEIALAEPNHVETSDEKSGNLKKFVRARDFLT